MNYFIRKIWYSTILSIIVVITACTSTYAWYAMNFNNNVGDFNFGIQGASSIFISTDGINFKDGLDSKDIIKSILSKKGYEVEAMSETQINTAFQKLRIEPVTPLNYKDLSEGFEYIVSDSKGISNDYFNFDLYLTTDSETPQEIYFNQVKAIKAENTRINIKDFNLLEHPTLGKLDKSINLNIANAMRIGVSKYEVIPLGNTSNALTKNDIIYTTGQEEPSLVDNVYSFGGINAKPNVALDYFNHKTGQNLVVPNNNRQDIYLGNNEVIGLADNLTSGNMIKLSIYIWLEGWDADCFDVFHGASFSFNLSFATYKTSV